MQRSNKVVLLWETKGLGGKLAVICKKLFLPRETMARIYPPPANSWRIYLYYPVRLKYLLVRHSRALLQLTSGDSKTQALAALKKWLLSG